MVEISPHDSDTTNRLLQEAEEGRADILGQILTEHRPRLTRMVAIRLDPRLAGRVDPSDIIQESQLEAARRLGEFLANPTISFFLWLRLITGQCVLACHRRHLGAQRRNAARDMSLDRPRMPHATSVAMAAQLLGKMTSPSQAAIREEMKARLHEALDAMDQIDREVLTLRHFEQLTARETSVELGITEEAAKKRYLRAIKRLKVILTVPPARDHDE